MAESIQQAILKKRQRDAVAAVAKALEGDKAFCQITDDDVGPLGECVIVWRTVIVTSSQVYLTDIGLHKHFPDEAPVVRICDWENLYLKTPHVMENGILCTIPHSAALDSRNPIGLFWYVINQAKAILEGPADDDFRTEFLSYWNRQVTKGANDALIIDPIKSLEQSFPVFFCQGYICVALTAERLNRWVSNRIGKSSKLNKEDLGVAVYLNKPLLPDDYPETLEDLISLVTLNDKEAKKLILSHIVTSRANGLALLIQKEGDGVSLGGLVFRGLGLSGRRSKELTHGFRLGHVPQELLLTRATKQIQSTKISRNKVVRVDHQWIHSRGGDGRDLSKKSVLVIGCGSLGGYVAHLLARAGVGHLTITDNDTLGWENLGRHILGASSLGHSKSKALAEELTRQLPHLNIKHITTDWRNAFSSDPNLFDNHDVVVSTVADWRCEGPLNELARRTHMPPVLLGWLEPFAVAGHCLVVAQSGGCFECSANRYGQFLHSIADFEGKTILREPGGCTHYQHYAPSALMPVASMISSVVIDVLLCPPDTSFLSTCVSSKDHLESVCAKLSDVWAKQITKEGYSKTYKNDWNKSNTCRLCGVMK